jgi:hypothetical protein
VRRAWKVLEVVLTVVGTIWLLRYLDQNRSELAAVTELSSTMALLISISILATWAVNSYQSVVLFRSQGVAIGVGESMMLLMSTSLLNYIPIRIGTVLRLRYMRRVHDVEYSRSLGLVFLRMFLVAWISALLALIGLLALRFGDAASDSRAVLILSGGLVFSALLFFIPLPSGGQTKGIAGQFWLGFSSAIAVAKGRFDLVGVLILLLLLQIAIVAIRLQLAFTVTGNPMDWPVLLIVAPLAILLTLFSFASLGIREALIGAIIAATGSEFSIGVFAASVERGALIVLSFTFGSVATMFVLRRLRALD